MWRPRAMQGRRRDRSRILRRKRSRPLPRQANHATCDTVRRMSGSSNWTLEPPLRPRRAAPRRRRSPADDAFGKPKRSWLRRKLGAAGAAIVALFAKLKARAAAAAEDQDPRDRGTALVSVAAYSLIWGWEFAAGFVVLIFIHEMGHVIALRREGIKASAPMFIPFMGAVIARALARRQRARRGARRPRRAAAGLGSRPAPSRSPARSRTARSSRRSATSGCCINLFNLLPVVPLDGGRAMAAMTPWMWFLGFGALVVLDFLAPNPILLIITLFAGYELCRRWEQRRSPTAAQTAYYRVSPRAPARRRRRLRRPDRAARARHARDLPAPRDPVAGTASGAPRGSRARSPARCRGGAASRACRGRPCHARARSRPSRAGP